MRPISFSCPQIQTMVREVAAMRLQAAYRSRLHRIFGLAGIPPIPEPEPELEPSKRKKSPKRKGGSPKKKSSSPKKKSISPKKKK